MIDIPYLRGGGIVLSGKTSLVHKVKGRRMPLDASKMSLLKRFNWYEAWVGSPLPAGVLTRDSYSEDANLKIHFIDRGSSADEDKEVPEDVDTGADEMETDLVLGPLQGADLPPAAGDGSPSSYVAMCCRLDGMHLTLQNHGWAFCR